MKEGSKPVKRHLLTCKALMQKETSSKNNKTKKKKTCQSTVYISNGLEIQRNKPRSRRRQRCVIVSAHVFTQDRTHTRAHIHIHTLLGKQRVRERNGERERERFRGFSRSAQLPRAPYKCKVTSASSSASALVLMSSRGGASHFPSPPPLCHSPSLPPSVLPFLSHSSSLAKIHTSE